MKLTDTQKQYIYDYIEQNMCDGDIQGCMLSAKPVINEIIEMLESLPSNTNND